MPSSHAPNPATDFGLETIEILLQVMENERDKFVVILAGYQERMDTFFHANPGMRSRVAHHLDFADYELDGRRWNRDDLMRLEPEDILTSQALSAPAAGS